MARRPGALASLFSFTIWHDGEMKRRLALSPSARSCGLGVVRRDLLDTRGIIGLYLDPQVPVYCFLS
jgi:hypothetical protein